MKKKICVTPSQFTSLVILIVLSSLFFTGCSKENNDTGKVIATVNKEKISLNQFERELALRSKQNPNFKVTSQSIQQQLDSVIDRRLMVQEAMAMGLTKNADFVRTIQIFWEQTLIRELIEAKNHEWKDRIFVTEGEVNEYYKRIAKDSPNLPPLEKLFDIIKKDISEEKQLKAVEEWLDDIRKKASIDISKSLIDEYLSSVSKSVSNGGGDGK